MTLKYAAPVVLLALAAGLSACGNSPGTADAKAEITTSITRAQSDKFGISISLGSWSRQPGAADDQHRVASWSAEVTFPEAYGYVEMRVNNRDIVHVAAKNGGAAKLDGTITAEKSGDRWLYNITTGDPWASFRTVLAIPPVYYVVNGTDVNLVMRRGAQEEGCPIDAWSTFNNAVQWDSAEGKKIIGDVQTQIHAAAAAETQRERAAASRAAPDPQRAAEERQQKAAREQLAFAAPVLKPFQGTNGLVIATAAGRNMGWLLTDCVVDEKSGTVTGKGVNLQRMPFTSFTFQATAVPGLRELDVTTSTSDTPLHLGPVGTGSVLSDGAWETAVLDEAGRSALDRVVALGRQLGTAQPLNIAPEILTAAAATSRQADFQTIPLTGMITHQGKKTSNYDGLFAGKVAGQKAYSWKNETMAIRLASVVSGTGLYIKGSTADTAGVVVVINGVHTVKIDGIPKAGGALLPLPPDLQILDLRFEAQGSFQTHGIMLIK